MERSDRGLLEAHRGGDPQAFAELVRRHGPSVLGYLRKMTGNADTADDLFQETFRRVHEKAHTLKSDRFKPWLFTIATRLALDGFRRNRRVTFLSLDRTEGPDGDGQTGADWLADEAACEPVEVMAKDERRRQVRQAIGGLPPRQRVTLVLAYYQRLSYPEVAEVLGCSTGAVKTQMFRALKSLAQRLPEGVGETT
jgi:RNA polymerase sigma-70 factor, ECF subfamily